MVKIDLVKLIKYQYPPIQIPSLNIQIEIFLLKLVKEITEKCRSPDNNLLLALSLASNEEVKL